VRRWLCRRGHHGRWWLDSAMFVHAERCGWCNAYRSAEAGALLERERDLWGDVFDRHPHAQVFHDAATTATMLDDVEMVDPDG
jgi:hypothetical protein